MRFIVTGFSKDNQPTVLEQGEDRSKAVKCFDESLADSERFSVVEMRSGESGEPESWQNVVRQETGGNSKIAFAEGSGAPPEVETGGKKSKKKA